jgi:hypothetical protein
MFDADGSSVIELAVIHKRTLRRNEVEKNHGDIAERFNSDSQRRRQP